MRSRIATRSPSPAPDRTLPADEGQAHAPIAPAVVPRSGSRHEQHPLGPIWPPLLVAIVAIVAGVPLFARDLSALAGIRYDPCLPVFGTHCPAHEIPSEKFVLGLIPLSGLGLTYSLTVVVALLLGLGLGRTVVRTIRYLLLLLALPAALISVYLLFLLVSGLAHGCPYCFTGNVCSLLQAPALWWSLGGPWRTVVPRGSAWMREGLSGTGGDELARERRSLVRLTTVNAVLLYVFLFAVIRALTLASQVRGLG